MSWKRPAFDFTLWLPTFSALSWGALGGGLLTLVGFPAGWLCGSMISVSIVSLAGVRTHMPDRIRDVTFIVLGVSLGSALTSDTLDKIFLWPGSLVILVISIISSMVVGTMWLRRIYGWDIATARMSCIPGALSAVLAVADETTANMVKVATAQTIRQLVLVGAVPVVVLLGGHEVGPRILPVASLDDTLLMLAAGLLGSSILSKARLPGAKVIGGMTASAVLQAQGWVSGSLHPVLLVLAFVSVGALIGSRFYGTPLKVLVSTLVPALGSIFAAIAVSGFFAALCHFWLSLPFAEVWLAYAPGALEAMMIVAFALNFDPSFVGTHHVVRMMGLMLLSPLWAYGLARTRR